MLVVFGNFGSRTTFLCLKGLVMSDYEDKCKYYENLYKPKSSSSGSSGSGKSTTTKATSNSPQPCPTPTPTSSSSSSSSSDSVDSSAYVEMLEDRGQLQNLISNTRTSKTTYNTEVGTLSQSMTLIDNSSPVVEAMISHLNEVLGDDSYNQAYDSAITSVSNSMP